MGGPDTAGYSAIVRRMSERGEFPSTGLRPTSSSQLQPEQPIEVRRSLDAIWRARWMIVAFVVATTAVVVGISP